MGFIRIKRQALSSGEIAVPENALLFHDLDTGDYYFLSDNLGNILTWGNA